MSKEETEKYINEYLEQTGFTEHIGIRFSKSQVAPTSMTYDARAGKSFINVRLPCQYQRGRMLGVLDHEIGTHFMRSHNEKFQIFFRKRD